jgi:hypothetical protein
MENEKKILIPDLLDKNTPAKECENFINAPEKLCLIYDYDYLPNYVIPRLIVEMKKDIELVWRTGVILNCKASISARALVFSSENQIRIIVTGDYKEKRSYLSVIRLFIDNINEAFTIKPLMLIPLPGHEKYYAKYQQLIKMEKAGEKIYKDWDIEKEFVINKLLDAIESIEEVLEHKHFIRKTYLTEIKIIKIFLASSSELEEDRKQFESMIYQETKILINDNIFLELEMWEDFIDAMDRKRLQDKYNEAVKESDIFVMLFWTKVGIYTKEEFETAFGQFQKINKPLVYTCFKNSPINTGDLNKKDSDSLFNFQEKLKELGHFRTNYMNIDDLKYQFSKQLRKILPKILKKSDHFNNK